MYREMIRLLRDAQEVAPPPVGVWTLEHVGRGFYALRYRINGESIDPPAPVVASVGRMVHLLADLVAAD